MQKKRIRKAVLPVAGLGTRFLPATKALPKEMLTIVDRPIIQYVVDEARAAGIEHIVFVTGRNKHVIEDHFDIAYELEDTLRSRDKKAALKLLEAIRPAPGTTSFTRQQEPLGLGHAIWCARDIIGDEPFAILLPDMLMKSERGCLSEMVEIHNETGNNVISVEAVPEDQTHNYGIVEIEGEQTARTFSITGMVEKPAPGTAPTNLFINGRYILQPRIFDLLGTQETGAGGEIQLTDAMLALMGETAFTGFRFEGETYDCGSKSGFLAANIAFALEDQTLAAELRPLLAELLKA
ncbi:MAG: UTP--glucose-1-phosphate uridylyltransferase [Stappia sp.]|uniref:UTP--glucose-1-phosphate uridylyltransferase GalU n=1 Tax=Stappia sp. TaxID=1870903 RepID=UPI000C5882F6|nr:UTP--glucose-1-phosphate uridylyltransferase GalU [Stappia sp.]MAA97607.1 UTP--glucose-1-phosphate uridylyltransferase [Stappia sp.]MBM22597.1 UTP--glucose-1-phosphate uridylyltransferase [Stappia sp.]|tara:strand:- start:490 stop:1371 length:882 start_codon:yes stop_codon:yes gene_type:complete